MKTLYGVYAIIDGKASSCLGQWLHSDTATKKAAKAHKIAPWVEYKVIEVTL